MPLLPLWTVQLGNNLPKETEELGPWRERPGSSGAHKDLGIEEWLTPMALRIGQGRCIIVQLLSSFLTGQLMSVELLTIRWCLPQTSGLSLVR